MPLETFIGHRAQKVIMCHKLFHRAHKLRASMDDSSVQTVVVSNIKGQPKSPVLRRMVLVLAAFAVVIGALLRSTTHDEEASIVRALHEHSRALQWTPYDTTTTVTLPSWTDSLADVWDPILSTDTPMFWSIPKAGGTTLVRVFSFCLGLVLASNKGIATADPVSHV